MKPIPLIAAVVGFVSTFVFCGFLISFVQWKFHPADWSEGWRFTLILLGTPASLFSGAVLGAIAEAA